MLDWEDAESSPRTSGGAKNDGGIEFRRLALRPNAHFVYGGDTVNQGAGDIHLVRALVGLKGRYPDRVHLLASNRDLNKVRLSSELSDADMALDVDEIPGPFWDRSAPTL